MMMVERLNGRRVAAILVRHLRTLTPTNSLGGSNYDVDLFRLADGTEIECISPDDARVVPVECDPEKGSYRG